MNVRSARSRVRAALALTAVVPLALAACSSTDAKDAVAVTASDDACEVAETALGAGRTTFRVTNEGSDVTEVYVYASGNEVVGEVENIGAGASRNFTVSLTAGEYEVACKPGMQGDGIRTEITVKGGGGRTAPAPDRTVDVTATDYAFAGLDGVPFSRGEAIAFVMTNAATSEEHEFELFAPDGEVLGEVGPTKPGATGRVVLELDAAGSYRYVCGIGDHEAQGMVGSFTVT